MKIGYARKSREKQDLATQISLLVKAGVDIDNIYSDSQSGATQADTRPGFNSMCEAIETRGSTTDPITEIVVSEFSRIGRDSHDSTYELLRLGRMGVKFTSLSMTEKTVSDLPIEMQLPALTNMAMGADLERKHIKERTTWALQQIKDGVRKTKSGKPIGRPIVTIDWAKVQGLIDKHGINETAARKLLGYKASTFYKKKNERANV